MQCNDCGSDMVKSIKNITEMISNHIHTVKNIEGFFVKNVQTTV